VGYSLSILQGKKCFCDHKANDCYFIFYARIAIIEVTECKNHLKKLLELLGVTELKNEQLWNVRYDLINIDSYE
jgi:hypothetical protein